MKRAFFLGLGTLLSFAACSSSSSNGGGNADGGTGEAGVSDASTTDGGTGTDSGQGTDSGTPAPNGLAWTSGKRLRAILSTADTAHLFGGWHDQQLDVDCMYGLASDAMVRCLPINGGAVYDDAACTNAAAAVANVFGAKVKYVPDPYGPFSCGKASDYYALGATYVPAAVYTKGADGSCNASTVDSNTTYSHLGAKVLPSVFVAEHDVVDPRGTKVSAIQWVGDDGSRQDGMLIDLGRNNGDPCGARLNKAGSYFCAPTRTAFLEGQFADATCATGAAFYPTDQQATCGQPPTAILDSTSAAVDLSFFEPGAKITTLHQGSPANCQPYTKPANISADFYAAGAALPLSKLPPLTIKEQGAGRMQQHTLVTDKGTLASILDFYDSGKSTVCREAKGTDGVARCMPVFDKAVFFDINDFLDAACTQPTLKRYLSNPAPTLGGWGHANTTTLNQFAIVTLGAKLATPAAVYSLSNGVCNADAVDGTAEYYATTVVPPTDFVPITRTIE